MIDLRSDTVTSPGKAMRDAMARAPVGDDVYGEDPTVRALEERVAELLGKAAGAFFPSGTQSNLSALLSHCRRGDEYLVGARYHIYCNEAGGGAVLGGLVPCPLATDERGGLSTENVLAAIKEDDSHFPRTQLLCMENTVCGMVQDAEKMAEVVNAARGRGLRVHLDGARLMNAAVAQDIPAQKLSAVFDSVSFGLSKGLGAPAGTVLAGDADFICAARRWRKMLGGGMRQSGILAAAGLWALENNIERLRKDHQLAEELAHGLMKISVPDKSAPDESASGAVSWNTNMVYFAPAAEDHEPLRAHWEARGILVGNQRPAFRMVTHLDITQENIADVIAAAKEYYNSR